MLIPDANRHLAGAVAGAAVPGLTAAASWWLGAGALVALATPGIPIGLVVGWWIGPRAATPGRAIPASLLAAVVAVGLAVVAACVIGLVDYGTRGGDLPEVLGVVVLVPYVIAYALVLGL